jgi:hypothetical protein
LLLFFVGRRFLLHVVGGHGAKIDKGERFESFTKGKRIHPSRFATLFFFPCAPSIFSQPGWEGKQANEQEKEF